MNVLRKPRGTTIVPVKIESQRNLIIPSGVWNFKKEHGEKIFIEPEGCVVKMKSINGHNKKLPAKTQRATAYQTTNAEFIGWQPTPRGEIVALYNIIDQKHPCYGSTVTAHTLRELNLQVPATPPRPLPYVHFKLLGK